jgi:hypothetical protein
VLKGFCQEEPGWKATVSIRSVEKLTCKTSNGGTKLVEQDERTLALFFTALRRLQKDNEKITKTRQPDQYLERVNLFFETEAQLRRPKADLSA